MAEKTLYTIIQARRGTSAEWLLNKDIIPRAGEPCVDLDTGIARWGNGVDTYENLNPNNGDVNVLEVIKLAGTALPINEDDKSVDIPLATALSLGLVKGSNEENGVTIAPDGTMSVNNINVNKLVQTDGDTLILDGGGALA